MKYSYFVRAAELESSSSNSLTTVQDKVCCLVFRVLFTVLLVSNAYCLQLVFNIQSAQYSYCYSSRTTRNHFLFKQMIVYTSVLHEVGLLSM